MTYPLSLRSSTFLDVIMAGSQFTVPPEFKQHLRQAESAEPGSDAELIAKLCQSALPITSEKNVWAFWDKGVRSMPLWCQRNVCGWIRLLGSAWKVRILDSIECSPNYALKYVPTGMLPSVFASGTMDGPYVGQHSADFLRGPCLYLYGGVWMDVGIILLRHLDQMGWSDLESRDSDYQICVPLLYEQTVANHFIMSRKGDPFIRKWHDLFSALWADRKNCKGLLQHHLLSSVYDEDFVCPYAFRYQWKVTQSKREAVEYAAQVLCFRRLARAAEDSDGFCGSDYFHKRVLKFDALSECWHAEQVTGFNGRKIQEHLSTRLDGEGAKTQADYNSAYDMVWHMLAYASMQKVTRAKLLTDDTHLGTLWDEDDGRDREPGTFAALLRYGSVHLEQTRSGIVWVEAERSTNLLTSE